MDNVLIAADKPLACPHCKTVARIRRPVGTEDFPIAFHCDECKNLFVWYTMQPMVKVDPAIIPVGKYWRMATGLTSEQAEEPAQCFAQGFSAEPMEEIAGEAVIPFAIAANALKKNIEVMSSQVTSIERDLYNFRIQMGQHFTLKWRDAIRFKRYWREEYLEEFLDWPIMSFPVECDDLHSRKYARWVLCPRFFAPKFGIQVPVAGGFGLQLCNQFTRLAFPLENEEAIALQVESPAELTVIGNKIIGPSLPFCWRQIPGLANDQDATVDHVSVYIKNNEETRSWLANYGVQAWEKKPIVDTKMAYRGIPEVIGENEEKLLAWNKLAESGRVGIFFSDLQGGREAAMHLATMIRGTKCFFVNGDEDVFFYRSIQSSLSASFNDPGIQKGHYVYIKNGQPIIWEPLQRTSVCVVDMNHGGVDSEFISQLYNYQGIIIVVSSDAFFDFNTDNITGPRVYGLAGFPCFDTKTFPVETKNSMYMANEKNENAYVALVRSLKTNVQEATYDQIRNLFYRDYETIRLRTFR